MAIEQTLSIIKPDAVGNNLIGRIYARFEENGLRIVAAKMLHMTRTQAEKFYAIHQGKPFYNKLVEFMISGPVMVQVLEGEDAITKNRQLMGATAPKMAAPGTIRHDLAYDSGSGEQHKNVVHGSDSPENAASEISFFFRPEEICSRTR